jgi:hypothetical protein
LKWGCGIRKKLPSKRLNFDVIPLLILVAGALCVYLRPLCDDNAMRGARRAMGKRQKQVAFVLNIFFTQQRKWGVLWGVEIAFSHGMHLRTDTQAL